MSSVRPEDALIGAIALAAVGWIVWILVRGVRDGRLPIGKGEVLRAERPGPFRALFAFWMAAAAGMAFVGLDLLFKFTEN